MAVLQSSTDVNLWLGIDFGTSGARAIAIDANGEPQATVNQAWVTSGRPEPLTQLWRDALYELLAQLPRSLRQNLRAIAIDGTSATVLLCDHTGQPLSTPLLYNDGRGAAALADWRSDLPASSVARSATGSLAKLLWFQQQPEAKQAAHFLHQSDWLAYHLHGQLGISDYHNALKLGYDVERLCYPDWLLASLPATTRAWLPRILAPGAVVAPVTAAIAAQFALPATCQVCTGTTDSIAAFLASGTTTPGTAVTSLGSTLVLKLLSRVRVEDASAGIYSHRLGDLWLTGGASNSGGAVLQHFFDPAELVSLSQQIDPTQASPLSYYPLLRPGDRFPVNDPELLPQLEPRPDDPAAFLHGLLESMARLEAQGYARLQALGATPLCQVYTAGGGAQNPQWMAIRQRHLGVPVAISPQTQAAYGSALLAQRAVPMSRC
ncbi:MAG: FGGY-family carbohydrate kinase [Spirulinaceae cyanobacterium SM2_1_0]|nr:FGGY-family carbohydrate kinase [Spirulinaceae cyanobacterium SM2_1_0]